MSSNPERDERMRPGMERLLKLLRGQGLDEAGERADGAMLRLAEEERVLPWVVHAALETNPRDAELIKRLKKMERDAAIAAFFWGSELKSLLRAFEQARLAVVPLKGPVMAERLYGGAALRTCRDLDLLVAKEDLRSAEAVLAGLGFIGDIPDDYHRQWMRGHTVVELHHDVENPLAYDFHVASVLERAQPAAFQGQGCRQLAAGDELLFLCLHGVRHRFAQMSLVLDLCFAFEKLEPGKASGREMAERSTLLTLGLAMARRLRPETAAGLETAESAEQAKRLESVAERLWLQMLREPGEAPDWQELHAFYLEIEAPGRRPGRRVRHWKILATRVIRPDYEFAARFGCHRRWQAWMLRPLRLVWDALRRGEG